MSPVQIEILVRDIYRVQGYPINDPLRVPPTSADRSGQSSPDGVSNEEEG